MRSVIELIAEVPHGKDAVARGRQISTCGPDYMLPCSQKLDRYLCHELVQACAFYNGKGHRR